MENDHNGQLPKHTLPKYQILGYPQSDVQFQIDLKAKTLFLIDLDKGGRSLTNDMNNALCRLIHYQRVAGQPVKLNEFTIFYSDSTGTVDGVRVSFGLMGSLSHSFYSVSIYDLTRNGGSRNGGSQNGGSGLE